MICRAIWSPERAGREQRRNRRSKDLLLLRGSFAMLRITKKRTAVIAGAAALVLAGTTAAFAYWTTSGSGSGSASVASAAHTLTRHATTSGNLYPGASVPVSFTADNASSGGLQVNKVQLVRVTDDTQHASCTG